MRIVLFGPQRRPTVDQLAADLDPNHSLATVTAGWQEREPDDQELDSLLGGRTANLKLYGRWLDIVEKDPEFAAAELEHRTFVDELRLLYVVQLDATVNTVDAIARRNGERAEAIAAALDDARAAVQLVDERHMDRVHNENASFEERWRPTERPVIAHHLGEVHDQLAQASGLVVTGGHVGVLLRLLKFFGVGAAIPDLVVAWSAGAMALTERVVLFHDRTPRGPSPAEVYDDGLGVMRNMVMLPHARRRLAIDDVVRMQWLARRFEPAHCVVLDDGVRVDLSPEGELPTGARVIDAAGHIVPLGVTA